MAGYDRIIKKARYKRFKKLENNEILIKCTNDCRLLLDNLFNNVNFLFKQRGLSYYKMIKYYKANSINIDKGYLSKLNRGINNTCNILIISFIANYLNIPICDLLTKDFTLNEASLNINDIEISNDY
jgi:hypothetical protein